MVAFYYYIIIWVTFWSIFRSLLFFFSFAEILSVFPDTGSLGGRTDITITGDFFDNPVQVTIAGNQVEMAESSL